MLTRELQKHITVLQLFKLSVLHDNRWRITIFVLDLITKRTSKSNEFNDEDEQTSHQSVQAWCEPNEAKPEVEKADKKTGISLLLSKPTSHRI